tara:strand:- start:4834 stop:6069 length:1236 start_codon:yes stop_codon:yes gene_type:complete
MFIIYELVGLILLIFSPIIIVVRIFQGKEDIKRFKEKFCIFTKKSENKKTIWIHGASVGEILSIIPIIHKLENDKRINKILITSSTTSSAVVFSKYNFKKTVHQFFPIDINFLTKIFINYWKPKLAIFVDSEIWPNMYKNLNKNKIPIILLNARITKKTFKRWKYFPIFSKNIFNKITLALPQNKESSKYLENLGTKKIKIVGNLKYFGESKKKFINKNFKNKFSNKILWCAASTHNREEIFIGKVHKELKLIKKNLLTIIIPRHINRKNEIVNELNKIGLKTQLHSDSIKLNKNTDIYLVDTYGEAYKFYGISSLAFLGGSLIPHGGQNPLEPAREGNYIIYGPNIDNFKEVYEMLKKLRIASKVKTIKKMKDIVLKKINYKQKKIVNKKLYNEGIKILNKNFIEINKYI